MIIEKTGTAPITGYGASDYTEIIDPNLDADYVYFDSVNGAAGTDWMRGRRGYPVNNWADLVTIATARHTKNVMILNGVLTLTSNGDHYYFTGNGFVDPTALFADNVIELGGFTLTNCSFTSVNVHNAAGGILDMCGSFDDCPYVFATTIQNCGLFRECGTINATTMTECDGFFTCLLITVPTITDCTIFHNVNNITATTMTNCHEFIECATVNVLNITSCTYFKGCSTVGRLGAGVFSLCTVFDECAIISAITMTDCANFVRCGEIICTVSMTRCSLFLDCFFVLAPTMVAVHSLNNVGLAIATTIDCTGLASGGILRVHGYPLFITNLTGAFTFEMSGESAVDIAVSNTAGIINVYGNVKLINNTGGTVVNDYTNKPKAEVAINTTATNGAETALFDLSTAGFHYTVERLRLKCADPGVNTVTVRLYELINGASTEVDSFAITTVNFATYFSLMDMFGVDHLAGDNLKITVRASAGGPYAVTGSYAYRSA